MIAKDIAAIIVEAGIIPPCDEQDAVEKLDGYGFVDDDLAECRATVKELLKTLKTLVAMNKCNYDRGTTDHMVAMVQADVAILRATS
jgi:hypothetical protein